MKHTLLILALLASGCAKRQLENTAKEVNSPDEIQSADIRFTYEVKNEFSTQYFGMIGFVLENNTHQWITVDSIEISSDSVQKANIAIVGGNDIDTWFASMSKAKQIESMNRQRLWGSITFVSALGGAMSKDEETKRAARITAATGGTLLTLERFNMIHDRLELSEYFPEDHLMRTPFRIPPGLGVDKWMVINTQVKDKDLITSDLQMKVFFSGNNVKEYNLNLIKISTHYTNSWQRKLVLERAFSEKKR